MVVRVHDGNGLTIGWLTRQSNGTIGWRHSPETDAQQTEGWHGLVEFAQALRPDGGGALWHDLMLAVPHDDEPL